MKTKTLMKYVVEFIMAIALFFFTVLWITRTTVFKESYIKKQLKENNYYQMIYEKLQENMSYYVTQSGLEEEIIVHSYTLEEVSLDMNRVVESMYQPNTIKLDTSKIRTNMKKNIDDYLARNHVTVYDQNSLNVFIDKMMEIYENEIKISNILDAIHPKFFHLYQMLRYVFYISFILVLMSFLYLMIVSKRGRVSVSLMTTGILLLACEILLNRKIDIEHIMIYSEEVSLMLKVMMKDILHKANVLGAILTSVGLTLATLKEIKKALVAASRQNKTRPVKKR